MNEEQTTGLLTLLSDLGAGIKDLTSEVKHLVGNGRVRSIRTSFSDKVSVNGKTVILSVQLGREVPDDIARKDYIEEYNKLKDGTVMLVNKWEKELEKE